MPLYDYRCSKCQNLVEVRHGFNDRYAEPCSKCGGEFSRVFNPAPIVFKGSGFYVTDSRKGGESKPEKTPPPAPSSGPSKESAA
jgi:putative FmdB family regulatory protein